MTLCHRFNEPQCECCYDSHFMRAQLAMIRELCESATVSISRGCTCYGNECTGCGYGTPLGWTLNPEEVLSILDSGDSND